jgi:phage terminase large subunit-like protein
MGSQSLFLNSPSRIQCLLGGNGSGKSETGGYKTARYLLTKPPPRKACPFWIVSKSYEMVGGTAWGEKLRKYIHPRNVKWISYLNKARDWPSAVGLKNGWIIEFKSWEQGREAFQARSIGGAWFDEQFPEDVFLETFARTRDYSSPIWITLTPIDPDPFLQERYDNPPDGWDWFSLDLEDNRKSRGGHLDDSWIDAFIAEIPEDFRDVRVRGKFAGFAGAVFKQWRREVHVCDPFPNNTPPTEGVVIRSLDFGFNNPFVCLWMYRDYDGVWTVYDEYYQKRELMQYHARQVHSRPVPKQGIVRTWADPEDAQSRAELAQMGIATASAKKDVMPGIEELQRLLMVQPNGRPRFRVTRNCKNTLREMASYQWETNTTERKDAADEPKKKDDHTVDAARYGVFSEKQSGWLTPGRITGASSLVSGFNSLAG